MDNSNATEKPGYQICGNETYAYYQDSYPSWFFVCAAIVTILTLILGVTGNTLFLTALLKCHRTRNVTPAFNISLCVGDLLLSVLALPLAASMYVNQDWASGDFLCIIYPLVRYAYWSVSLLTITMISINRCIVISNQKLYDKLYTPVGIGLMIGFCWVWGCALQIPTLFQIGGKFGYDGRLRTCTILSHAPWFSFRTVQIAVGFCIPFIAILYCYGQIFTTVWKSGTIAHRHTRRNEMRVTKTGFTVFLTFIVCYLPFTIIRTTDTCADYPLANITATVIAHLSACVNPIIYVVTNRLYRTSIWNLITPHKWKLSHGPESDVAHSHKDRSTAIETKTFRTVRELEHESQFEPESSSNDNNL